MPVLALMGGLILFVLGSLPIRSAQKVMFGAWFGNSFSDNPKYLFQYANSYSDKRCIWITGNRSLCDDLRKQGYEVYLRSSWWGIWHQLTAKTFFVCVSSRDCNPFCQGLTAKVIMMNHGMPMKAIGFDVDHGKFALLKNWIRHRTIDSYSIVCSNGKAFGRCLTTAYKIGQERIVDIPAPRLDGFDAKSAAIVSNDLPRVLWLPTHRSEGRDVEVVRRGLREISSFLSKADELPFRFIFRPHPYDAPLLQDDDSFPEIEFATEDDVYRLLAQTDVLISDYSSVIFDFAHIGKPILGFMPDYETYRGRIRDFYFDPKEIYAEHYDNSADLIRAITSVSLKQRSPSIPNEYLSSDYQPGRCSEIAWKRLVND